MLGLAVRLFDEHPEAADAVRDAVPRVHGRRVPGRQPAATGAARPLARRSRRALRRRRRLPDDLLVHGRVARAPARRSPSGSRTRRSCGSRRTTAPRRRSSRSRTRSRRPGRVREGAARRRGPTARARPRARSPTPTPRSRSSSRRSGGCTPRASPWDEMAVLYRINARSEPFEEAFAAARHPVPGARRRLPAPPGPAGGRSRGSGATRRRRRGRGRRARHRRPRLRPRGASPSDDEEVTRQADLGAPARARGRVRGGAAGATATSPGSSPSSTRRFATEQRAAACNLLTYHRAKGLEFDAVFLPRLLDGELPFRSQHSAADPDEERRLLYVGITRARTHLYLRGRASRGPAQPVPARSSGSCRAGAVDGGRARGRTRGAGHRRSARRRAVRPSQGMATQARVGRRRPRLRRVPRHDAGRIAERQPGDWADLAASRAWVRPSSSATPTRCSGSCER